MHHLLGISSDGGRARTEIAHLPGHLRDHVCLYIISQCSVCDSGTSRCVPTAVVYIYIFECLIKYLSRAHCSGFIRRRQSCAFYRVLIGRRDPVRRCQSLYNHNYIRSRYRETLAPGVGQISNVRQAT